MNKYKYSYLDEKSIYCYKNSDVLINKLNIQDEETFYKVERLYSGLRQSELLNKPIDGDLDFKHLKAIHFYLFQDLFYWAGKIRTVAIAKGNLFCLPQYIETYAQDIFDNLRKNNYLQELSKDDFINSVTNLLADINALHPFREGNGRTQREFIRYIGLKNGYGFDWSKVGVEENIVASYESANGNNEKLRMIISKIIYRL